MFNQYKNPKTTLVITMLILLSTITIMVTNQAIASDYEFPSGQPRYAYAGETITYEITGPSYNTNIWINDIHINNDNPANYEPLEDTVYFSYKRYSNTPAEHTQIYNFKTSSKIGFYKGSPNGRLYKRLYLTIAIPENAAQNTEIIVTVNKGDYPLGSPAFTTTTIVNNGIYTYNVYPGTWPSFSEIPETVTDTWNEKQYNTPTNVDTPSGFTTNLNDPWYDYLGGSGTPYDPYDTFYCWMGSNNFDTYDNEWRHTTGPLHARIPLNAPFEETITIMVTTYTQKYVKNSLSGQYTWTEPIPTGSLTIQLNIQETHQPVYDQRPTIAQHQRKYGKFICHDPVQEVQPGETAVYDLSCQLPTGCIDAAWHNYQGNELNISFSPPANPPSGYAQSCWLQNSQINQVHIQTPTTICEPQTIRIIIHAEWRTTGGKPHNLGWFHLVLTTKITPTEQPDLTLEKTVSTTPHGPWQEHSIVNLSENVYFNLTITNTGTTDLTNIVIRDELPTSLNFVEATPTPSNINNNNLSWTIDLLSGETQTIQITTIANQTTSNGINWVYADYNCNIHKKDNATFSITQPPQDNMTIEKLVRKQPSGPWQEQVNADIGDTVRFKITICYQGDFALYNLRVKDMLPEQLQYADNAQPVETHVSSNNQIIWWNISHILEDGECINIEFDALVVDCGTGVNTAIVTADECSGHTFQKSDTATVHVECPGGMTIEKLVKNSTSTTWQKHINANIGDTLRFKITICYEGFYSLYNIHVKDVLPAQLTYANQAIPAETSISADGHTIWWNLTTTLSDGDCTSIEFNATVVDCETAVNTVTVTADECSGETYTQTDTATIEIPCDEDKPPNTTKEYGSPFYTDGTDDWITFSTPIYINATDPDDGVHHTIVTIRRDADGDGTFETLEQTITVYDNDATDEDPTMGIIRFTFHIQTECHHKIEFYSVDNACNQEELHWQTVYVDNTPPESKYKITHDPDHYVCTVSTLTLTATDKGACPVDSYWIYCKVDGELYQKRHNKRVQFQFNKYYGFTEDGRYEVEFWAEDDLGNEETPHHHETFIRDTTPPDLDYSFEGPHRWVDNHWQIEPTTKIKLTATDSGVGVGYIKYRLGWSEEGGDWITYTSPFHPNNENIFFFSRDKLGNQGGLYHVYMEIVDSVNDAPAAPQISGPTAGKKSTNYTYSVTASDPDDDQVYYLFKWGNTTTNDWHGPYPSNHTLNTTHLWENKGEHTIKVKAKDEYGAESSWTTLSISISQSHAFSTPKSKQQTVTTQTMKTISSQSTNIIASNQMSSTSTDAQPVQTLKR